MKAHRVDIMQTEREDDRLPYDIVVDILCFGSAVDAKKYCYINNKYRGFDRQAKYVGYMTVNNNTLFKG